MNALNNEQLIEAFPEAKQIILSLLKDMKQQHATIVTVIADQLAELKSESSDESYQYFWRQWLGLTLGEELQAIERHIARLHRQLRYIKGTPSPEGTITDDMIQAARDVPVEDLLNQSFRRSGHNLIGICPFHDERTPSFHVYTQENRGWCFGCNRGGDSIAIYMLKNDCGFKDAVSALVGGQR
jgi:DNA primase